MGDMHNLQIIVSLGPRQVKATAGLLNGAANGAQIINIVSREVREKQRSQVKKASETERTERTQREKSGRE